MVNGKWYGLHLYSAFIDLMATKALYIFASHSPIHTLIHTLIHTHTHRRTQLELGVLLTDTLTLGQVEPGIEPPTFQFVVYLHVP